MRTPSLTGEQLGQLTAELFEYYNLGDLFSGDFDGVARWIIRQAGSWYFGDALGELFSESVINQWVLWEHPYIEWA